MTVEEVRKLMFDGIYVALKRCVYVKELETGYLITFKSPTSHHIVEVAYVSRSLDIQLQSMYICGVRNVLHEFYLEWDRL